jgi:hypothetical protein
VHIIELVRQFRLPCQLGHRIQELRHFIDQYREFIRVHERSLRRHIHRQGAGVQDRDKHNDSPEHNKHPGPPAQGYIYLHLHASNSKFHGLLPGRCYIHINLQEHGAVLHSAILPFDHSAGQWVCEVDFIGGNEVFTCTLLFTQQHHCFGYKTGAALYFGGIKVDTEGLQYWADECQQFDQDYCQDTDLTHICDKYQSHGQDTNIQDLGNRHISGRPEDNTGHFRHYSLKLIQQPNQLQDRQPPHSALNPSCQLHRPYLNEIPTIPELNLDSSVKDPRVLPRPPLERGQVHYPQQ